ncbi:unnamed protein product, partial [Vitis vinifera]
MEIEWSTTTLRGIGSLICLRSDYRTGKAWSVLIMLCLEMCWRTEI